MKDEQVKLNLFFIYSRKDKEHRDRLETHLYSLKRKNYINPWHDGVISPGQDWKREITKALSNADIILILVSVDFLASDYCYENEMTKALERHERGDAVVIPIILRDCDWHDTPIGKLQALPNNGDPIIGGGWKDSESGFRDTTIRLKQLIEDRLKNKESIKKQLSETINSLEAKIDKLTKKNKELNESLTKTRKSKNEFQSQLKEVKLRLNDSETASRHSKQELEKNYKENKALKDEMTKLEKNLLKLQEELKTKNVDLERVAIENQVLKNKFNQLVNESEDNFIEQHNNDYESPNKVSLELKVIELKTEIQSLLNRKSYLKKNKELNIQAQSQETRIKDLEFKLKKQDSTFTKEREEYSRKINRLEDQISKLKKKEKETSHNNVQKRQ